MDIYRFYARTTYSAVFGKNTNKLICTRTPSKNVYECPPPHLGTSPLPYYQCVVKYMKYKHKDYVTLTHTSGLSKLNVISKKKIKCKHVIAAGRKQLRAAAVSNKLDVWKNLSTVEGGKEGDAWTSRCSSSTLFRPAENSDRVVLLVFSPTENRITVVASRLVYTLETV